MTSYRANGHSDENLITYTNLRRIQAAEKVFIVMELAEDGDLLNYVKRKKFLSDSRSRLYFLQIIDALNYLHGLDVAHR